MSLLFVLTAALRPSGTPALVRWDPAIRLLDYQWAAERWALVQRKNPRSEFLLVENTGADVGSIIDRLAAYGARVHVISYQESAEIQTAGKGVAEAAMFHHVARWLEDGAPTVDFLAKVTGRLHVANFSRTVKHLPSSPFVAVRLRHDLRFADSRFFVTDRDTWIKHLMGLENDVDESAGRFLEHALAERVLLGVVRESLTWTNFSTIPDIRGVSASHGTVYGGYRARIKGKALSAAQQLLTRDPYL